MRRYVNMAKSGRMAAHRLRAGLPARPGSRVPAARAGTDKVKGGPATTAGPHRTRRG